jgi:uncharacterized damage-inducible protein DinB
MDLLDRLLGHDAWTTRELLLRSRHLTDDELDREFDIGHGTLRCTFLHIIRNMEVWTDLISGVPVHDDAGADAGGRSIDGRLKRLDVVVPRLQRVARRIADAGQLDELWIDHLDDPPTEKSYGSAIVHLATHGMHHRAQVLFLLRKLGVTGLPEGDAFSWETQHGGSS